MPKNKKMLIFSGGPDTISYYDWVEEVQNSMNYQQYRWASELGRFDFEIYYRPGRQNVGADVLSWQTQLVAKPVFGGSIFNQIQEK